MTDPATLGWPFAVARGHDTGYQVLLAPEFITTARESGLLMSEVHGEVPDTAPPRTTTIAGQSSGPVALVYRTTRLTRADVGGTDRPEAPMLDRAGRPLLLAYGFACRGVRVLAPDERDLQVARDEALATYRRFHAAEADFLPEVSHPYHTRSTVAPIDTAPTRPAASRSTAPWTADVLPTRRPAPARRIPTTIIALVAVLALVVFLIGYLASRSDNQIDDDTVAVPSVVNQPVAQALRDIADAGLVADVVRQPNDRPEGTVVKTDPPGDARVPRKTTVHLWVSSGLATTTTTPSATKAPHARRV